MVVVEVTTVKKKTKEQSASAESEARLRKLLELLEEETKERLGPDATYEEKSDAAFGIMRDVLWRKSDQDLRGAVTTAAEVEVEGKRYARLDQASSATYYGRWGKHLIEEPLYREVGVHNGPTIKPIELRIGMIARHMTPDLARVVGELSAKESSRELEKTLRTVGMVPPGRAFLERREKEMAGEIADQVDGLEELVRESARVPTGVASVSCGLDRFSVRMSEPAGDESDRAPTRRKKPYERTPPPPKEHNYRKAWVGSTTVLDGKGEPLHTWCYAVEADADPVVLANRVAADVAWVLRDQPTIPVHCVQDAAPELRALPEAPNRVGVKPTELIDFEHLCGYLDAVVDACEPEGDPHDMKGWYQEELLRDDHAIDRIYCSLRDQSADARGSSRERERNALAAALSYIHDRKDKMRYASHYAANLPIGSGATKGTCWTMQRRVQRPGQSWEVSGLRGTLALRSLVLSERWSDAWKPYAAAHRWEIN